MSLLQRLCFAVIVTACFSTPAFGQSGKIAGTVTDAATGSPLPGVNVVVVGTQQGATTDAQGQYTILNVSPGTYDVRASFVGFAPVTQQGVNVNIDLTTEVNFEMQEQTEQLEEVTVQATEPVVKRDISANVANINAQEMENLPVSSFEEVVSLQAGVKSGLRVRGGGANQVALQVDGFSMRNGRTNSPSTNISYTAIKEVQVQTGGFNAEYGNVRSGLVNVVTKEGPRDYYTADVLARYMPAQKKYYGHFPDDPNAYWMRPYLDDEVAWEGTDNWDIYTQRQYPDFEGWNKIAANLKDDNDPTNDLTPEQAQQVFLFRHRKNFEINDPDYTVDASVGGPVPLLSEMLGDLRFFGSFRQSQNAYIIPQIRDAYQDRMGRLKLTADIAQNMKLNLLGSYSSEHGINQNNQGWPNMIKGGIVAQGEDGIFANDTGALMDLENFLVGGDLTHTLSANTFYQVRLQRMFSDYSTYPGPLRDESEVVETIGDYELDEAPFGWMPEGQNTISGMRIGGHWATGRDSSEVAVWSGEVDLTSQLNEWMQFKTGLDYIYNNYDVNHGEVDSFFVNRARPKYRWNREPTQGAVYAQNKLEFEGLIANVGLRLDYFNAGPWYEYEPFSRVFSAKFGADQLGEMLEESGAQRHFRLSPRLGVSFPVTENSKMFFNYGIFRQMLNPDAIYAIRRVNSGAVDKMGNPAHPMPSTIAYELGYEQNLFNQLLLRVTGYYRTEDNQPRNVRFTSIDGQVNYAISRPYNYADIRGVELTLRRNRGWVRGFANYTYMSVKRGDFGYARQFQNRVQQRRYERNNDAAPPNKPIPQPYARINLEFLAPPSFGPTIAGVHPLGDWRLSFLGTWEAGDVFTWHGGGGAIQGLQNNLQWEDYYNLDMRLSKNISAVGSDLQLFMDVSNVLDLQRCCSAGFQGPNDYKYYLQSLHLPEDAFQPGTGEDVQDPYQYIPGDDQPGDYREPGTSFVPIEVISSTDAVSNPMSRPLYYVEGEDGSGQYMSFEDGSWQQADQEYVDTVLENKQYIDMPNEQYFTFLNPRRVMFGLRVSL